MNISFPLLSFYCIFSMCLAGCGVFNNQKPVATGAASVEELLDTYIAAHQTKYFAKLDNILLWNATRGGTWYGIAENEQCIKKIFEMKLERVIWFQFPPWDPRNPGREFSYQRPKPAIPGGIQTLYIDGYYVGKICLEGTVVSNSKIVSTKIDPSFAICYMNGRYYLYADTSILSEAADAVTSGLPQVSTALPVEGQVEHIYWEAKPEMLNSGSTP